MFCKIENHSYNTIALFILFFILYSCNDKKDDCHYYIKINNKSTNVIYFYLQGNYPDTSIGSYNPIGSPVDYKINSRTEKQASPGMDECFEGHFQLYPTLELFLFDANTLESIPWDTIRKKYLILKRYDLTIKGIQNANWEVSYP